MSDMIREIILNIPQEAHVKDDRSGGETKKYIRRLLGLSLSTTKVFVEGPGDGLI